MPPLFTAEACPVQKQIACVNDEQCDWHMLSFLWCFALCLAHANIPCAILDFQELRNNQIKPTQPTQQNCWQPNQSTSHCGTSQFGSNCSALDSCWITWQSIQCGENKDSSGLGTTKSRTSWFALLTVKRCKNWHNLAPNKNATPLWTEDTLQNATALLSKPFIPTESQPIPPNLNQLHQTRLQQQIACAIPNLVNPHQMMKSLCPQKSCSFQHQHTVSKLRKNQQTQMRSGNWEQVSLVAHVQRRVGCKFH